MYTEVVRRLVLALRAGMACHGGISVENRGQQPLYLRPVDCKRLCIGGEALRSLPGFCQSLVEVEMSAEIFEDPVAAPGRSRAQFLHDRGEVGWIDAGCGQDLQGEIVCFALLIPAVFEV